jgi:diguanylate cyclase
VKPDARRDRAPLHRVVYPFRVAGLALGGLPVATVLFQRDAAALEWLFLATTALLWPQLAYVLARRGPDPRRVELRSLLIDSAIAGTWVGLMHFNLLPSALLLALTSVDKISTGIRGLWRRSLPGMLAGVALGALATGGAMDMATAMPVVLACLPAMLIHTVAVSLSTQRLIRKVGLQNLALDRLHRVDMLTGVSARADWEQHAERLLQGRAASDEPACLLLIDVDEFKQVNDHHGHAAGDDVLRALAATLRAHLRPTDRAGRIGGDEFVVLLPATDEAQAQAVAEELRVAVAGLRLRDYPDVRPTISIGLAMLQARPISLRAWLNAADRAMYRAKHEGRNRVTS